MRYIESMPIMYHHMSLCVSLPLPYIKKQKIRKIVTCY